MKGKRERKWNWTRKAYRLQCRSETCERKGKRKLNPAGRASDSSMDLTKFSASPEGTFGVKMTQ